MAAVGEFQFPLQSIANMEYLFPFPYNNGNNGSGSGSEISGSTCSSFDVRTGDLHSDQSQPFDISEYFLMDEASTDQNLNQTSLIQQVPLVQEAISPPLMDNLGSENGIKRPRTERIAFRMKSKVEIIDDGFKWRKYGKKSVKNSPNPRNYYKCSSDGCSVKKRVEREKDDERYVITTYEGVHNHVSPSLVYYTSQDVSSGRYFVAGYQISPCS